MPDILIVYSVAQWPPVATVHDALYSLERHSSARCWYLNLGVRRLPLWARRVRFDAVVFHTTFLWDRVNAPRMQRHLRRLSRLAGVGRHRLALPQDEFLHSRALNDVIRELDVDHVFSVASESEWPKIYAGLDRGRVGISRLLTGYLAPETVER